MMESYGIVSHWNFDNLSVEAKGDGYHHLPNENFLSSDLDITSLFSTDLLATESTENLLGEPVNTFGKR